MTGGGTMTMLLLSKLPNYLHPRQPRLTLKDDSASLITIVIQTTSNITFS